MDLSSHHCDSAVSRTMSTVHLLSRPSVLRFATRCCICHVVIWSPNYPNESSRDHAPTPCWASLDMHSTSIQDPSMSRSLGPCFHCSTAIQLDQNWKVGFKHPKEQGHWCVLCPPHSCSQPQKNRQRHAYSSSNFLVSEESNIQQ